MSESVVVGADEHVARFASSSTVSDGVLLAGRALTTMSAYVTAFSAVVPAAPAAAPRMSRRNVPLMR